MGGIFVSYRRGDSDGQARALVQTLSEIVGRDSVFIDVDNIGLGRDFRHALQERLDSCDHMLTLIGRDWLEAKDASGNRRLDDPDDYVRLEIAAALKRNISVTPVLLAGARMPLSDELPKNIRDFAYRNGTELRHSRWESDVEEMVSRLNLRRKRFRSTSRTWVLSAAFAVIVVGALVVTLREPTSQTPVTNAQEPASPGAPAKATSRLRSPQATETQSQAPATTTPSEPRPTPTTISPTTTTPPSSASTTTQPSKPPVVDSMEYSSFPAALSAAFADATNDFAKFKGEPEPSGINFIPKMKVTDGGIRASNIFHRDLDSAWGFRFVDDGPVNDELAESQKTQAAIEDVFRSNGLKVTKAVMPSKNIKVESYRYTRRPYVIEFNRGVLGTRFFHEIIILHMH